MHMNLSQWISRLALVCSLLWIHGAANAQPVTIAAASDLRFALDEIITQWTVRNPEHPIRVIYGSSGRFATQIRQGAPFDIYMSADAAYAHALHQDGFASGPATAYAIGRIVLWSRDPQRVESGLDGLRANPPRRLAIARPSHAPYGARAREALQARGLWSTVEPHLVYGENISGTAQMAESGAADAAIIALSLALHPDMQQQGHYSLIEEALHAPLLQALLVTRRAHDNDHAHRMAAFMLEPDARAVLQRYGFAVPPAESALPLE